MELHEDIKKVIEFWKQGLYSESEAYREMDKIHKKNEQLSPKKTMKMLKVKNLIRGNKKYTNKKI